MAAARKRRRHSTSNPFGSALPAVAAALSCAWGTSGPQNTDARTEVAASSPLPGPSAPAKRVTPVNVYAASGTDRLSPVMRGDPALVYVPNSMSDTVDVISERSFKIIASYPVGALPRAC